MGEVAQLSDPADGGEVRKHLLPHEAAEVLKGSWTGSAGTTVDSIEKEGRGRRTGGVCRDVWRGFIYLQSSIGGTLRENKTASLVSAELHPETGASPRARAPTLARAPPRTDCLGAPTVWTDWAWGANQPVRSTPESMASRNGVYGKAGHQSSPLERCRSDNDAAPARWTGDGVTRHCS